MRKILSSVAVAVLAATQAFASVDIDATNFPDVRFRTYVSQNFDENSDVILSDAEIAAVRAIDMRGALSNLSGINLKGIENFTALKNLACTFMIDTTTNEFNYTDFKTAYGLDCEIDDSYFLMIHIDVDGRDGLMTPLIRDIADVSTGDYILKLPVHGDQDVESISFRTKGNINTEVHVLP
ncbi:MAG: hypothetical protein IJP54_04015 [Synergistaceae bacterium]|nr:hypothetical protein [Synergistaceae bacterium]MBR0034823.1 hypothetical protein [Synergistaceae bacterium]